jgi:GntR family transcriptional regulator
MKSIEPMATLAAGDRSVQRAELERDSAVTLYGQIAAQLRDDIDGGCFSVGARLPSEHELTERFNVSRVTVRQAIAHLLVDGYVIRKQGKGTFVAGPKVQHELQPMRGFYDSLIAQGVEPKTELLEFASTLAPERVAGGLASPDGRCFLLRRRYLVNDAPIALVCAYLPPETAGVSWQQANEYPIYGILERLLKIQVVRARIRIRAQSAGSKVGKELGLGARAAMLVMERESFNADGKVTEHTSFYIRPENYEFMLSVQGPLPIASSIRNNDGTTSLLG